MLADVTRAPSIDRPRDLLHGCSLEITAKDIAALEDAAPMIAPGAQVAVAFLPGEAMEDRIAAALRVRALGFVPCPHVSARRIASRDELAVMIDTLTRDGAIDRMFLIAGDPPHPRGPFGDTLSLLGTGLFERAGIRTIGIAGHPEGHPMLDEAALWRAMTDKIAAIRDRGMAPMVVTQFCFDPAAFLSWLAAMRERGIDVPVRIGLPGPAGIKRLLGYARKCGVGASTAVLTKYGISIANLLGSAGPDRLVAALRRGLTPAHGDVRVHFYPFGGLTATAAWIDADQRSAVHPRLAVVR